MQKNKAFQRLKIFLLALYLLAAILPLYWIVLTSLKGSKDIYTLPLQYWVKHPTLESYQKLFSFTDFGRYFLNSITLSLGAALMAMIISFLGGYALSRYRKLHIKKFILLAMYFTQTIPSFIIMVPLFRIFSKLGLIDNRLALGIVYTSTVVAFSTIMCKSFLDRIPVSLEEAAKIDGCTLIQALGKVIFPMAVPGMAAIFCFSFVNIWNELFLAVMLLMSNKKMTVPVALNSFISKAGISWDVMSAGIVVALLPTMIVFAFGQKYIVAGLTAGSVKE